MIATTEEEKKDSACFQIDIPIKMPTIGDNEQMSS
jgi:hypothetical protein